MKNSPLAWLCCAFVSLLLASCGEAKVEPTDGKAEDNFPTKIISVVPSATEMLFAIGKGGNVIAVGDYDQFPPEAATRPRIGGLLNPNIERIIELNPDLVITYGSQDALRQKLSELGIQLYPFTHGSIDETLQYMIDLGRTVGAESEARKLVADIRTSFDKVRAEAPSVHPRVLLIHNRGAGILGSFYSVGLRAFQHELIAMAGGENLFGDVDKEAIQPSLEEIISRLPDIIIETLPPGAGAEEVEQRKQDWRSLKNLPAVKNNRIHIVSEDYMLVPGPRLHLAARKFAELIAK